MCFDSDDVPKGVAEGKVDGEGNGGELEEDGDSKALNTRLRTSAATFRICSDSATAKVGAIAKSCFVTPRIRIRCWLWVSPAIPSDPWSASWRLGAARTLIVPGPVSSAERILSGPAGVGGI